MKYMEIARNINDKWIKLWTHYADIKITYNLTSHDILRQLNADFRYAYLDYLSFSGKERNPSTREGTVGKGMWTILISGLSKTDWTPSTATYEEKLTELRIDGHYQYIDARVKKKHEGDSKPILDISICMNEMRMLSIHELEKIFTIDGIVPMIGEISKSYYL
jgi:hypothetical protein